VYRLTAAEETMLLEQRSKVETWVVEFASRLGKRRPPAVRISPRITYYAPIGNKLVVAAEYLAKMSNEQLRVAVAHEMGHYQRRWLSLLAWRLEAKLHEELQADRVAIELTNATPEQWAEAVQLAAQLEGNDTRDDFVFAIRQRFVAKHWKTS
jgi:Zn-dependent protease with chaperone function